MWGGLFSFHTAILILVLSVVFIAAKGIKNQYANLRGMDRNPCVFPTVIVGSNSNIFLGVFSL